MIPIIGSQSTIDLPQVAINGSQRGGKSSILEALVGHDFLLRGSSIYPRHPLVLQLLQTKRRADGHRTIGVITKLDIMDRGTDAHDLLLGKVIPLWLGYVGIVNRSQENIMLNKSIKDALVAEEEFFCGRPVYNDLLDRYGIPQLAKMLNQEVDPCEGMTDDDIRTAIQNGSGVKAALFVPEVSFEALVRRQISCLLDPSLQCSRFIYDELMKINHKCMVNEVQRFPVLRKPMDEVLGNFLGEGLEWSEAMIRHIIDMMLWSLIRHHHLLKKSQQTSHLLNRFKPWSKLLYITFEGATRCHTLGGQLGAWGGAKGAGAGLQGAEGGSGAPLEVDALVRQGNMTVFVNVASHFSTGAYGFWSGRWSYQDRILPNRVF